MKKRFVFVICCLVLISSLSVISAFSFSDFWTKFTGQVVDANCEEIGGDYCGIYLDNAHNLGDEICEYYGCWKCNNGYLFENWKCVKEQIEEPVEEIITCEEVGGDTCGYYISNAEQISGACDIGGCYKCKENYFWNETGKKCEEIIAETPVADGIVNEPVEGKNPEKVTTENKKDMTKYSDKEVFLISDKNWVSCSENDLGIIAKYKFWFWAKKIIYEDFCFGDNKSREYACDGKKPYYVNYECENICENGTCKKPNFYDLTVSDDPLKFLGDRIAQENISNWKNYPPLISKVNELTQNKTDEEKVKSISWWVKYSKPYGSSSESPANKGGTVIDIFNSKTGICYDASVLTVAMMRLANIPSRCILSSGHTYVQYNIDGNWKVVDTNFGTGEASGTGVPLFTTNKMINLAVHHYNSEVYTKKGFGVCSFFREFSLAENYKLFNFIYGDENNSGFIYYPAFANYRLTCNYNLTSNELIDGEKSCRIINVFDGFRKEYEMFGLGFRAKLQGYKNGMYENIPSSSKNAEVLIYLPRESIAFDENNPESFAIVSGTYFKSPIPKGEYKICIKLNADIPNSDCVAYANIEINKDEEIWVDKTILKKSDGISTELFNSILKVLEEFKYR